MADDYIHGIRVVTNTDELRVIAIPGTGVIGVVGTAPGAAQLLAPEKPVVFFQKPEAMNAVYPSGATGPKGTLFSSIEAFFAQGSPTVVISRAKSDAPADINLAIESLLEAESATGYKPEIICAPGHTGNIPSTPTPGPNPGPNPQPNPANTLADPVVVKLKEIATRLNGILIADGPDDKAKQQDYRKANGTEYLYIVHPKVKALIGGVITDVPLSAYAAGVFGTIKFWESPSNRIVQGILGTSRPISFALDDPKSEGQLLNSYQVATVVRQDGFRLWGARGSGDATDQKSNQIQKLRIRNAIKAKLISSHRWAVGMGITKKYFITVTSSVNAFLALLQSEGAIAGGECYALEEKNPPSELFNGNAHFFYSFTPTPVSERLTFEEIVTDKYLTNVV